MTFLTFSFCQVRNFAKFRFCLNRFEISKFRTWQRWLQNFSFILNIFKISVIFWKYPKLNRKSTKNNVTEQMQSIVTLKFREISLVSWNLFNYCKILQFFIKFCKSLKDFRKILLKWFGKTVKYQLNFVNFLSEAIFQIKSLKRKT